MLRESLNRAILGCWEDKLEEQSYSENTAPHKSLSNTKLMVTSMRYICEQIQSTRRRM